MEYKENWSVSNVAYRVGAVGVWADGPLNGSAMVLAGVAPSDALAAVAIWSTVSNASSSAQEEMMVRAIVESKARNARLTRWAHVRRCQAKFKGTCQEAKKDEGKRRWATVVVVVMRDGGC